MASFSQHQRRRLNILVDEKEGADEHLDIKEAIKEYLDRAESDEFYQFISFDDYPKYGMYDEKVEAPFVDTLADDSNPFYGTQRS